MRKLLVISVIFASLLVVSRLVSPKVGKSAALTSASVTLSNPRLSYRAGVATATSASSHITIDTSGNPDNSTNHLFPKDSVCFTPTSFSGCKDNLAYTVAAIKDTDEFSLTADLGTTMDASDLIVASQAGSMTITFTTTSEIPATGDILVTIPMSDGAAGNDGFPDTNTNDSTGTSNVNGFDLNNIAEGDISVTGCTDGNWNTTETITAGSGTTDHTIRIDRQTASCAAGTEITVTIDSSPGIVNPAPKTTSHTQGGADIYAINIKTRDDTDATLDEVDVRVAPVEAVLVSATIDETLAFTVAGITTDSGSYCGVTRTTSSPDSTAVSIPWGTISTANSFLDAAQLLTVSTNASGGYSVKIEENDQMGKDGGACSGASAGEANNCIQDTTCGGTPCSESSAQNWTDATTYQGMGYSLANVTGTDAAFTAGASFSTKQLPDQEAGETKQTIMTHSSPVNGKQIYVCYRIAIAATQPAGYYYNKVKYTATATF